MSIKFEFEINAEPETVFNAVTTKKGYQGWWAAVCDIDCKQNHLSSIRFVKEHTTENMIFKTIEVKNKEKLVWLCTSNNVFESMINNTLTFVITKSGKGSILTFTQNSSDPKWEKHPEHQQIIAGWDFFMDSLKQYCETGKGEPWG
jgi:uncharacterized protein YndB with AHSA1/START domain